MAGKSGKQERKGPVKGGESLPEITIEVKFTAGPFEISISCKGKNPDACIAEAEKAAEKIRAKLKKMTE